MSSQVFSYLTPDVESNTKIINYHLLQISQLTNIITSYLPKYTCYLRGTDWETGLKIVNIKFIDEDILQIDIEGKNLTSPDDLSPDDKSSGDLSPHKPPSYDNSSTNLIQATHIDVFMSLNIIIEEETLLEDFNKTASLFTKARSQDSQLIPGQESNPPNDDLDFDSDDELVTEQLNTLRVYNGSLYDMSTNHSTENKRKHKSKTHSHSKDSIMDFKNYEFKFEKCDKFSLICCEVVHIPITSETYEPYYSLIQGSMVVKIPQSTIIKPV